MESVRPYSPSSDTWLTLKGCPRILLNILFEEVMGVFVVKFHETF